MEFWLGPSFFTEFEARTTAASYGKSGVPLMSGRYRRCGSQQGSVLYSLITLGIADERASSLAERLLHWQWPDGGWNCDPRAGGHRSSFHESLSPAWGLHEYSLATGAQWAGEAADRAAELFLEHRVFRSLRTGEVINPTWLVLHYPPYWHYDVLQALLVLGRLGKLGDPRVDEALAHLIGRRRADGRWQPGGYWWRRPGAATTPEVVDWGRGGPNEMITLNALRVLRAAARAT